MKTLAKEMDTIDPNFELCWLKDMWRGEKNGRWTRCSSLLLVVNEQNKVSGSDDRLPNQQVLPQTRTKKGRSQGQLLKEDKLARGGRDPSTCEQPRGVEVGFWMSQESRECCWC